MLCSRLASAPADSSSIPHWKGTVTAQISMKQAQTAAAQHVEMDNFFWHTCVIRRRARWRLVPQIVAFPLASVLPRCIFSCNCKYVYGVRVHCTPANSKTVSAMGNGAGLSLLMNRNKKVFSQISFYSREVNFIPITIFEFITSRGCGENVPVAWASSSYSMLKALTTWRCWHRTVQTSFLRIYLLPFCQCVYNEIVSTIFRVLVVLELILLHQ